MLQEGGESPEGGDGEHDELEEVNKARSILGVSELDMPEGEGLPTLGGEGDSGQESEDDRLRRTLRELLGEGESSSDGNGESAEGGGGDGESAEVTTEESASGDEGGSVGESDEATAITEESASGDEGGGVGESDEATTEESVSSDEPDGDSSSEEDNEPQM
jgi:hypothetical protein